MATGKSAPAVVKEVPAIFGKSNYLLMLVGAIVIAAGMFLMAGGKSDNPAVFNKAEVYSARRITVAPIVIMIGLAIEGIAIFRRSSKKEN
ncbi:DUF3098 domain-containing protein [Niabella soli]|uniref:DUF3098 domain-containing protein n=1 Tax=Niabella soli DSM 19437 TaxID=929713 RepID=W0F039_9BACT|nr:DUF3098 domain-containing protein [Niabella soli]AHF16377.1 hypothetical protein NIASO_16855 [Niabella soli DSM 19437]